MPDTQIGAGKTLEDITIGLDTLVLNESKHWYRDPENKKLYAKCKVVQKDDGYEVYLTGQAEPGHKRKSYADPIVNPVVVEEEKQMDFF